MQTFLPFASFRRSAESLDRARLGKQRVECLQLVGGLLRVHQGERADGWANHPASRMWRHYETALIAYGLTVCEVWVERGYRDTCADKLRAYAQPLGAPGGLDHDGHWQLPRQLTTTRGLHAEGYLPKWFGTRAFHLSHRSNLVRKDPEHYLPIFGPTPDDLPYVWPV